MSAAIERFTSDEAAIEPTDTGIKVSGVLSMRSPSESLTPYLKKLHKYLADTRPATFTVDIKDLSFMNSSSIRALVDWIEWIRSEPSNRQYTLAFLHDPRITWQSTTLAVVRSLDEEHVQLRII